MAALSFPTVEDAVILLGEIRKDDDGQWVTINGNHVLIGSDGEIKSGHPLGAAASSKDPASMTKITGITARGVPTTADKMGFSGNYLTKEEKSSLSEYKAFGYKNVNAYLAGAKPANENVKPTARDIASVMGRSELNEQATVYRGVNGQEAERLGRLSVGDDFKSPCYQSTTTDRAIGEKFAKGELGEGARSGSSATSPTVIQMELDKGTHAIALAKMSGYADTEKELLVNRNIAMKVSSKDTVGGITYIRLTKK